MRLLLPVILIALPVAAAADGTGVHVDHVWSRAAMAGHEGVVYLTITDDAAQDTLTGVTTPVAAKAELHQSFDDHGVMKMRSVGPLPIEPGKPVTLAPGGYHIMLTGLTQALKQGDSFPITLSFAKAGQVTASATVEKAGAMMPGMDHGQMGGMQMPGGARQP
jgi:periplasmic copper chaperone A